MFVLILLLLISTTYACTATAIVNGYHTDIYTITLTFILNQSISITKVLTNTSLPYITTLTTQLDCNNYCEVTKTETFPITLTYETTTYTYLEILNTTVIIIEKISQVFTETQKVVYSCVELPKFGIPIVSLLLIPAVLLVKVKRKFK